MSKSVLVIDTPERCIDCEIGQNYSNIIETCVSCPIAGKSALDGEAESIPDWCPLKLLPEKDTKTISRTNLKMGMLLVGMLALMRLQEDGILMIDLTGKSVFVKTQEEYLSVLKIAKLQGFTWVRENNLSPIKIPFPNVLNFYDDKNVAYRNNENTLCEASEIVEDEERIKDAVSLVRAFAKCPDRTALTDSFIESLKLLADTVESQLEEVK